MYYIFVFILIDETAFLGTAGDDSYVPRFNSNDDIAQSEEVDRERGL